jgi:hypothetical protein
MKHRKFGFTMAECLTVLLIVLIMTSLLFPALVGARRSASSVVCASNMRQLYLAMKLYQADNGEYPPFNTPAASRPEFRSYYPVVLTCPESKMKKKPAARDTDYSMLGSVVVNGNRDLLLEEAKAALAECRSIRGASIPVVYDRNHTAFTILANDKVSRYFLIREDGSFDRPTVSSRFNLDGPCNEVVMSDIYNY